MCLPSSAREWMSSLRWARPFCAAPNGRVRDWHRRRHAVSRVSSPTARSRVGGRRRFRGCTRRYRGGRRWSCRRITPTRKLSTARRSANVRIRVGGLIRSTPRPDRFGEREPTARFRPVFRSDRTFGGSSIDASGDRITNACTAFGRPIASARRRRKQLRLTAETASFVRFHRRLHR